MQFRKINGGEVYLGSMKPDTMKRDQGKYEEMIHNDKPYHKVSVTINERKPK
jgi:hypothetical protein